MARLTRVPILHATLSPVVLRDYALVGVTPPQTSLHLSIGLTFRAQPDLDALLVAQSNPNSAQYHHYLSSQQFDKRYAPAPQTVTSVVSYLKDEGFHVDAIATNRLFVSVSGTVATTEKAFATTLQEYKYAGREVYAPSVDPSVPLTIGGMIQTIGGLDNVAEYHAANTQDTRAKPVSAMGYTPAQLRSAYDILPLIQASALAPAQTVALFELDGYNPTDVNTYLKKYKLGSPQYSQVLIDGATGSMQHGSVEVELDMEVMSAIAPNAHQILYIGPNSTAGVNDTYNKIVTDNTAKVTSISWGECEAATGMMEMQALHNIFMQGAAQGQSFFAASGDSGAYDCGDNQLAVDSPSDDPFVVGVGGTTLQIAPTTGSYVGESAWGGLRGVQRIGGGGGVSSYFARPTYQQGTNINRTIPDVSADAGPSTGYAIYCASSGQFCSGWSVIGGTSAAAPLWAAIAVDTNQYLVSKAKPTIGNVNAALYTIALTAYPLPPYHDVTTGTNLFYKAAPGYDMATGLGTPDAWNVARDLEAIYSPSEL